MTTAVLLLAAGASSRLGQPKIFLAWQGKTLLQHTVAAAATISEPVFVVAGAHAPAMATALQPYTAQLILHPQWQQGMGSSIATGVAGILQRGHTPDALLLLVCDQPFINPLLLQEMVATKANTGKGIIACRYDDTIGTPVLFDKQYFPALLALSGQTGAKRLLQQFPEAVVTIPFPLGNIDIDTPEDYERLKNLKI